MLTSLLIFLLQVWPHHHTDGGVWWMHWFWIIVWIALIAIIIALIARSMSSTDGRGRETARDILERRYAEGEISTEEYEERKKRL